MPYPLLLPFLWWSTASLAADDVPANAAPSVAAPSEAAASPESALANQTEVAEYVAAVRLGFGGALLLAAAGPDAEHLALKVAGALPPGQVRVLRIGYIGDIREEMRRAMDSTGLRCGVRLAPTSAAHWLASSHGECSAPVLPLSVATAAAHPSVAPPALGIDSPASPAPGVPYLTPPPPPPDPEVLAATYKLVALRRVGNPKPREDLPDATWAVRDGRGRTLGALDFARRTGDSSTERRIKREGSAAESIGVALAVGGGALVVVGLGLLVAREAGAPLWSDYEVNDADYTNAEYFEALAQAEADFRAAADAHAIRADDRAWISGFLIGAGALAAGTSPFALRGVADRHGVPALYWEVEGADALIDGHNASVRQRIGLPEPIAPVVAPPPPEEEDNFGLDDPPEDDPPEDDPPEDAPEPAPGGPSGRLFFPRDAPRPALAVLPFFGVAPSGADEAFGVAGLTGTF